MYLLNKYVIAIEGIFLIKSYNIFQGDYNIFFNCDSEKQFYDTTKLTKNDSIFISMDLGKLGLGRRAFDYGMLGYNVLKTKGKLHNDRLLTIADMSMPSGRKRLFVMDLK